MGPSRMGFVSYDRGSAGIPAQPTTWGHSQKSQAMDQKGGPHQKVTSMVASMLDFLTPGINSKFLLFISPPTPARTPQSGIVSQQHEWTETHL